MNMKIAGCVILYNPQDETVRNIETYIRQLDYLYLVNNGGAEKVIAKIQARYPKIEVLDYLENQGIAHPLNVVLDKTATQYNYLLTMDQDSSFSSGVIENYFSRIRENDGEAKNVASYAVNYAQLNPQKLKHKIITYYITSGSVLAIKNAIHLGGFDENLFIDQVDSEFAYRARINGYQIKTYFDLPLNHHLGNPTHYTVGGFHFDVLNHSPLRKYYIVRNQIYVMRKYPFLKKAYTIYILKEMIKILFFEKEKIKKIRYIFQAVADARYNHYGKYNGELK
jgi:rhamnosyltransferase